MGLTTGILAAMLVATAAAWAEEDEPVEAPRPAGAPRVVPEAWDPPKGLEFLRPVPELRGVRLGMAEGEFEELTEARELTVRVDRRDGRSSHWVRTEPREATGLCENVIVMFRDGACGGIQRMRPSPPPEPR